MINTICPICNRHLHLDNVSGLATCLTSGTGTGKTHYGFYFEENKAISFHEYGSFIFVYMNNRSNRLSEVWFRGPEKLVHGGGYEWTDQPPKAMLPYDIENKTEAQIIEKFETLQTFK